MNFGALEALITMDSPVAGFLPSLAALSDTSKVPKPTSCTFSPFFISSDTTSIKAFKAAYCTFEEDEVYNQKDAEGFIKLNALRFIIAGKNGRKF